MNKSPIELNAKLLNLRDNLVDWQAEESCFVPLTGCRDPKHQGSLVLDDEVQAFLRDPKKQIMLLVGQSGSGKSLYTQGLVARLLENRTDEDPIPLWISLPGCKKPDENAVEEALAKCGFEESQIEELRKTQKFIFIFDAYDEIRCLKNLIVTNRLHRWKAKSLFTCRDTYIDSLENFRKLFVPFQGEKPDFSAATVIYMRPFNHGQIEGYVKKYIFLNPGAKWKTVEEYLRAIEEMPGVKELVQTPYLLKLAVVALPDIAIRYAAIQDPLQRLPLTRVTLYDIFVQQWFLRQEKKLKAAYLIPEGESIQVEFWHYAKSLSQLMYEHNLTQVYYNPDEEVTFGDESDVNPFSEFFSTINPRTKLLRTSCMIRELSPGHFSFMHPSLPEYFLSQKLYTDIQKKTEPVTRKLVKAPAKKGNYFNERPLVYEKLVIQFLVDRISENPKFKDDLFDWVKASRNQPKNSIAASNAMTVLVHARVSFSGFDLVDHQLDYANLEGFIGYRARLDGANLSHCLLRGAYLAGASMKGAVFKETKFDENPSYLWPTGCVTKVIFSHDDTKVYAAGDNNTIIIYDRETGERLDTLSYHQGRVSSIVATADGHYLVSSSMQDKTIRLYDLNTKKSRILINAGREDSLGISYHAYFPLILSSDEKFVIYPQESMMGFHSIDKLPIDDNHNSRHVTLKMNGGSSVIQIGLIGESWLGKSSGNYSGINITIYDIHTSETVKVIAGYRFCTLKDQPYLAVATKARGEVDTIQIYSLPEFVVIKEIVAPFSGVSHSVSTSEGRIREMAFFRREGDLILIASGDDGAIIMWDANSSDDVPLTVLHGHSAPVTTFVLSADGSEMVSGSGELSLKGHETGDRLIRSWDVASILSNRMTESTHQGHLVGMVVSNPRRQIFTASNDGFVRCWSRDTGRLIRSIDVFPEANDRREKEIRGFCFVEETKDKISFIVANGVGKAISFVIPNNFKTQSNALDFDLGDKYTIATSVFQKYVAFGSFSAQKNSLRIYDYKSSQLLSGFDIPVTRIFFSENEELLVACSGKGCALIHVPSGKLLISPGEYGMDTENLGIGAVNFMPKSTLVAVSARTYIKQRQKSKINIIDFEKKTLLTTLEDHAEAINALVFSKTGGLMVSADYGGEIVVTDTNSWKKIIAFRSHSAKLPIHHLNFIDESTFVVGHDDGSLRVWSLVIKPQQEPQVLLCWHTQNQICLEGAIVTSVDSMDPKTQRLFKQKDVKFDGEIQLAEKALTQAKFMIQMGMFEVGLEFVRKAIQQYPHFLAAYTMGGNACLRLNRVEEAEHFFTMGVDKGCDRCDDPRALRELYFYRGSLYLAAGYEFAEQAEKNFQSALKIVLPDKTPSDIKDGLIIQDRLGMATENLRVYKLFKFSDSAYYFGLDFRPDDVKVVDKNGYSLLHAAASSGNEEVCGILLRNNADPCVRDKEKGNSVLMQAILAGKAKMPLIEQLVKKAPAVVNLPNSHSWYPIHAAVSLGCVDIVLFLLDNRADVNANLPGVIPAPLIFAIANFQTACARTLLERGANYKIMSSMGTTPLEKLATEAIKLLTSATRGKLTKTIFQNICSLYHIGSMLLDKYRQGGATLEELNEKSISIDLLKKIMSEFSSEDPTEEEITTYNLKFSTSYGNLMSSVGKQTSSPIQDGSNNKLKRDVPDYSDEDDPNNCVCF